jgi:hypothetical protein
MHIIIKLLCYIFYFKLLQFDDSNDIILHSLDIRRKCEKNGIIRYFLFAWQFLTRLSPHSLKDINCVLKLFERLDILLGKAN